jgi:hypothetical protein
MSHKECSHPKTKAARAACRQQCASNVITNPLVLAEAYAMNDMWLHSHSHQMNYSERVVADVECAYCEMSDRPVFVFERQGINVCATCERVYDVRSNES